jgi:hypothetical protein
VYPGATYAVNPSGQSLSGANIPASQRPAVPARPPTIRALPPDEPVKARAAAPVLPSPERLGISTTAPTPDQLGIGGAPAPSIAPAVDWNATRKRLQDLGALTFVLDRPSDHAYRVAITRPPTQAGIPNRVEGLGATEAEAVQEGLAKAGKSFVATP